MLFFLVECAKKILWEWEGFKVNKLWSQLVYIIHSFKGSHRVELRQDEKNVFFFKLCCFSLLVS